MSKKKGIIIVWVYLIIVVLLVLGSALLARTISENRIATRNRQSIQTFDLAEAGIDRALRALKADFSTPKDDLDGDGQFDDLITINLLGASPGVASQAFDLPGGLSASQITGQYRYRIDDTSNPNVRRIRAVGYVPNATSPAATSWVEAYVVQALPPSGFWDNTVWMSGQLRLNGNAYSINGNVSYETIYRESEYEGITGTKTQLPAGTPMYHLNFDQLKEMAIDQGHYCTGPGCTYPTTFWYNETSGIPNVTYIAVDSWRVTGNQTLGGIYVIASDVQAEIGSADIGGTVNVNGCVYALGNVKIFGTVDLVGGVWAGEGGTIIDGSVDLLYNSTYVNAFRSLVEGYLPSNVISWHEPGTSINMSTLE